MEERKHESNAYAAYLKDDKKILKSASGGVATALAEKVIDDGGYVVGVAYDKSYRKAEYVIVDDHKGIEKLKGSKYIEFDKSNIYRKVENLLKEGNTVLFFGLPCYIAGLYKVLKKEYINLVTCETICHGPTSAEVHKQYIEYLEKRYCSHIVEFSVRYKKAAWLPAYVYAKFENGKIYEEIFARTAYGYAFKVLSKKSCYNCHFKGKERTSDLTIGDFWGATEQDFFWNKLGVSVVLLHSKKGSDLLAGCKENIRLYETTWERAVEKNPMLLKSVECPVERERFEKLFNEKGLIYAYKKMLSNRERFIMVIYNLVPKKLIRILKTLSDFKE